MTREKQDGTEYHNAIVLKLGSEDWIKVKWEWKGFSPGSMSMVHVSWIRDSSTRNRGNPNYNEDNYAFDLESIGQPGLFAHGSSANSI